MSSNSTISDRRQIYRPFLERLNPAFSGGTSHDLIVAPEHDPRDPDQPPIHVAFANTAELSRGSQMALVGGIGSGKTTELQLTARTLKRHPDAINIYLDLADLTDINRMNPGAILIAIGMRLYLRVRKDARTDATRDAYKKLLELARGTTSWVEKPDFDFEPDPDDDDGPDLFPVQVPGLLIPRFPVMQRNVIDVQALVMEIATPLLESDTQITVLLDGLDRLIRPERFRVFVEQDLRALRGHHISLIVAAPLLSWFDNSRFLQEYFDDVKHIPAALSDPDRSDFLPQILIKRGAKDVMSDVEISEVARFSGGVLRDLITLARTSAEAAYRDDQDRIGPAHVSSAIRQLGRRYLLGLGNAEKKIIQRLLTDKGFSTEDTTAKQLLVNRQVLEYFSDQHGFFAVHPALATVLQESV